MFPCAVTPMSGAYPGRHWRSRCSPGSRRSRPGPSPPTRGPGGDVLGCRERRAAMTACQAVAGVVVAKGYLGPAGVCGRGGRLEPAAIARTTPERSWPPSGEGSNPAACWLAVRGRSGACRVTCGACAPVVPAGARRGPGGFDAARTGRPGSRAGAGPLGARPPAAPRFSATGDGAVCRFRLAVSALGGLGGAGRWSAVAASRPGLRKVRLCEGGLVTIPQIRY